MTLRLTILFFISSMFSCNEQSSIKPHNAKRILIEDVFAEGNISSGTTFNGLIKFYDTATNKLVIEAFYKNGQLDGKRTDYYRNGKPKNVGYYERGKQNGTVTHFDSTGEVTSKQDFYYDLKAGSKIEYKNGKPAKYFFSSFDNSDLFYLNYDSIFNIEIKKINDNSFFFWHINDIASITTTDTKLERKEGFIYIINPPEFNFEYSLCIINNKDSILRTEKVFNKFRIWDTFIIDQTKLKTGERFSLRLSFDRSLNDDEGEKGDMLKRL